MRYLEKAKNQLSSQKALIQHLDRALTTITKFENSFVDSTRLPVHRNENGRYIYLEDLLAIRQELVNYSEFLQAQFEAASAKDAKETK